MLWWEGGPLFSCMVACLFHDDKLRWEGGTLFSCMVACLFDEQCHMTISSGGKAVHFSVVWLPACGVQLTFHPLVTGGSRQ